MTKLLFASQNLNKVKEFKEFFLNSDYEIISLLDLNDETKIEENGKTFQENALIKARYFFNKYHLPTIADDSGLEIKALNGFPGVETKRREKEIFQDKANSLFAKLKGLSNQASFKAVLCFYFNGDAEFFSGEIKGELKPKEPFVENTFLYDNIFWPKGAKTAFCEFDIHKKNLISHRGQAISKLIKALKNINFLFDPKKTASAFVKDTFGLAPEYLDRLKKGRQNFVFKFGLMGKNYTIRIPGFPAYPFISYIDEEKLLEIAEKNQICPKTIYHNPDTGIKISRYIETNADISLDLEKVCANIKTIHQIKQNKGFDYLKRLNQALEMTKDLKNDLVFQKGFSLFEKNHSEFFSPYSPCLIHGDFQSDNVFTDKFSGRILISDFEFARTGLAIEDIASFARTNVAIIRKMHELYFSKKPTNQEVKAVLFARLFQMLFWNCVANFKKHLKSDALFDLNWQEIENYLNQEVEKVVSLIENTK